MCLYWRKIFKEAILNSWTSNILYAVSVTDSLDVGEEKLNAFIFPCSNGAQGKLQNRCIQMTEGLIKTVGNYAHYVKGGFSSEPRKEKHSVLKWKLFFFLPPSLCADMWSDSDEYSSDAEAAVRFNANADDLDDFCGWYILDIFEIDYVVTREDIKQFALQ